MTLRALPDIARSWFSPSWDTAVENIIAGVFVAIMTVAFLIFAFQHSNTPAVVATAIPHPAVADPIPQSDFVTKPTPDEIEMADKIRSDEDTIKYMQGQMQQMTSDIRTLTITQAQQEIRLASIEKNTDKAAQNSSSLPTIMELMLLFGIPSLGINAWSGVYFYRNHRRRERETED